MNMTGIESALELLGQRLAASAHELVGLVVCGGSGLILTGLVARQATKDVDVVALLAEGGRLSSPDPLPNVLLREARVVARDLDLPDDWLNNGPSRDPGGLFQLGLPEGFETRLSRKDYGQCLSVYFAGRIDQICFKVYAAVDQGAGRHVEDLMDMRPTEEEMRKAAKWAMTHDPSEGFRNVLVSMLEKLGYAGTASEL